MRLGTLGWGSAFGGLSRVVGVAGVGTVSDLRPRPQNDAATDHLGEHRNTNREAHGQGRRLRRAKQNVLKVSFTPKNTKKTRIAYSLKAETIAKRQR